MSDMTNYIYLLHEREFIKTKENVYKVGMTQKENFTRFNQYPKGSVLLIQLICNNCKLMETRIIKTFKECFKQKKEYGNEYFEGNYIAMMDIIYCTIKNEMGDVITDNNEIETTDEILETTNELETTDEIETDMLNLVECKIYNIECAKQPNYTNHLNDTKISMFNAKKKTNGYFTCESCNFKCLKKGDYTRHLITTKHTNKPVIIPKSFTCECGKNYKERTGLWKHRKICSKKVEINDAINITDKTSMINLLQQNTELQKSLIKLFNEKNSHK